MDHEQAGLVHTPWLDVICGVFAALLFLFLLGIRNPVEAIRGGCPLDDPCPIVDRIMSMILGVIVLLLALAVGLSVRVLAGWLWRRRRYGPAAGRPPYALLALALPLLLVALLGGPFGAWLF